MGGFVAWQSGDDWHQARTITTRNWGWVRSLNIAVGSCPCSHDLNILRLQSQLTGYLPRGPSFPFLGMSENARCSLHLVGVKAQWDQKSMDWCSSKIKDSCSFWIWTQDGLLLYCSPRAVLAVHQNLKLRVLWGQNISLLKQLNLNINWKGRPQSFEGCPILIQLGPLDVLTIISHGFNLTLVLSPDFVLSLSVNSPWILLLSLFMKCFFGHLLWTFARHQKGIVYFLQKFATYLGEIHIWTS